MKKNIGTILRTGFFLGIGIFFIWLFMRNLTTDQKHQIFQSLKIANYGWIAVAIVLGLLSHLSRSMRWKILMEPMGYKPKTTNVFMAVLIGYLANLALPRLGEVSRCGILTRYEKIPFNKSFGTVITERAFDMLTFLLLFFMLIVTQSDKLHIYLSEKVYGPLQQKFNFSADMDSTFILLIIGMTIAGTALIIFINRKYRHTAFYKKIYNLLHGLLEGIKSLTRIKKPFQFIAHTIFIWIMYLLMAYVVFFSLSETSQLGLDAGLAVLIFGSIGIMVVQGGIGIYPAIVAETLFIYSIANTTGYALGWLIWASQTIMILLAGVFSLLLLPVYNKNAHEHNGITAQENTQSTGT